MKQEGSHPKRTQMELQNAAAARAKEKKDSAKKRKDAVVRVAMNTGNVATGSFMIRNGGSPENFNA
eukprot:3754112-Rhodomonas_salina.1